MDKTPDVNDEVQRLLNAFTAGRKSANEEVSIEDLDSLRKALKTQEELVGAAEAGAVVRERVYAAMHEALNIPATVKAVCANCEADGLWLASQTPPLYCQLCFALFHPPFGEDTSTTSTSNTTTADEKSLTGEETSPETSEVATE